MRRLWLGAALLASLAGPSLADDADTEAEAEATAQVEAVDPAIFDIALEDFYAERWAEAAAGFWGYAHLGGPGAKNYEWANFFFAECMAKLGLYHVAVQYYVGVAKNRTRPEVLPEALARLEVLSRRRPVDEELVLEDLVYDSDFGALPENLTQWVNYVQGRNDYQRGFVRWGTRHFEAIKKDSPYALRAAYVQAVWALKKKQDDKAKEVLQFIIDSPIDEPDTKNRAHLALGRLLYDTGNYAEAMVAYDKVKQTELSFEQAQLLVEKAWTAYQLRDFKRAMGLLHALGAPSYERYFLPDAFLLRGIIAKELCHFIPAKRVVRAFRFRYQRALDDLHRRVPLERVQVVLDGATQEGPVARRTALIKTLLAEKELIDRHDDVWEEIELDKHIDQLYGLALREQGRRWRLEFEDSGKAVAEALLSADEQVSLLDYEVGLDIFKRLKAQSAKLAKEETLVVPYDSKNVYYEFDDEYWNDELHSYQYFIQSRCFEAAVEGEP